MTVNAVTLDTGISAVLQGPAAIVAVAGGMHPVIGLSSVKPVLESLRADESLVRFPRQR